MTRPSNHRYWLTDHEAVVLDTVNAKPTRIWQASDLIEATGLRPVDVLVALATLTAKSEISRVAVARYSSAASKAAAS